MSHALRYFLVIGGAVVSILLFLLASAADNSVFFDSEWYSRLLIMNLLAVAALLGLVLLLLVRLYLRYKSGQFGSRLMARMVLLFAALGIAPGAVIFIVSLLFVSRSIDSWFDVRVEAAIESGLNLGRAALDASLIELGANARGLAQDLSERPEAAQSTLMQKMRGQNQFQEASVLSSNGRVLATVGTQIGSLLPEMPSPAILRDARRPGGYAAIEGGNEPHDGGLRERRVAKAGAPGGAASATSNTSDASAPAAPGAGLRLRVVVQIPNPNIGGGFQKDERFLQVIQAVPSYLAANAEALRAASSEYQIRAVGRTGLRKMYIFTLTLTLLLAIFFAITSAFLLAGKLAAPLLLLAQGTLAVAGGDLSPRPTVTSNDELGTLTQSFNTMTSQLLEARTAVEKNRAELENAKAHLESVLENMSAGVMVLDGEFNLVTCNESVERILQHDFSEHLNQPLALIEGLNSFAASIAKAFSEQSAQSVGGARVSVHWTQQIEIPRRIGGTNTDHDITLLTRGSHLPSGSGNSYILVFDDISDVISAQRSIAWGEVAQRLAHEIKNPLTPIQLSAERMQMKLGTKLAGPDLELLNRGTNTIVNQVAAMKRMVNDFRDYAKTPRAELVPLDLNGLVEEVLNLYLARDGRDIIHAALAPGLPQVLGDTTQLRQVIHNLLQNAQDAMAERGKTAAGPQIVVGTEAVHYPTGDGGVNLAVRMSIIDSGPGFAPEIMARAFEPYVTSKPRGTGLGLAMVKKIVEEHGGRIELQNRPDASGAKVSILLLKLAPIV